MSANELTSLVWEQRLIEPGQRWIDTPEQAQATGRARNTISVVRIVPIDDFPQPKIWVRFEDGSEGPWYASRFVSRFQRVRERARKTTTPTNPAESETA